jgi:hypothetical protein
MVDGFSALAASFFLSPQHRLRKRVNSTFVGASSKEDILKARRMMREHGERWPAGWLRSRGLGEWAEYWEKLSGHNHDKHSADSTTSTYTDGAAPYANGEVR